MSDTARSARSMAEEATGGALENFAFGDVFGSEELKKSFTSYLQSELEEASSGQERTEYLKRLEKLEKHVHIQPQTPTKTWPMEGAANLCPPLTFKKGNAIFSKLLANYSTKRPFWSVESSMTTYADHAAAIQKTLNFLSKSPRHLNLKRVNRRMFWQTVFFGTQFYEVAWDAKQAETTQDGQPTNQFRFERNTPVILLIRTEDFLTRLAWDDLQAAPWVGIRVRYSWRELVSMSKNAEIVDDSGKPFIDIHDLAITKASEQTDLQKKQQELMLIETNLDSAFEESSIFELYKFWAFFDPKGDGNVVDLKGIIDLKSGALLRCEVNPVSTRLVGKIPYYEIPGFLYALGVTHILEFLQDEIESLHNQRIDSLSWGMLPQWVSLTGSPSSKKEHMSPGENHVVDRMDEFQAITTPDMSHASYPAEESVERYADQATGANEAMAGRADPTLKSGGGAEAQMILMQTGSSMLNTVLDTVDEYYAEIGPMLLLVIKQNLGLLKFEDFLDDKEVTLVREVFAMSEDDLSGLFKFSIETTDIARNEGARKEEFLGFSAVYTAYANEFTQLYAAYTAAAQQNNPVLMQFYVKCLIGKAKMMEKIVEFFHIGNPQDYIVDVATLEKLLGGQNGQSTAAGGNAEPGVPGNAGAPGPGDALSGVLGAAAGPGGPQMAPGAPGQPV